MSDETNERYALVTGATRGIGNAIARRLEAAGFFVIGTATSEGGASKISDSLERGVGMCVRVDDDDSVSRLMSDIKENYELPVVLVNNAGVTRDNLLMRMKDEEWRSVIETNVTSLYRMCKPLMRPMLKARWGRIVNISSVVGRMGNPGQTNYVTSKSAIEGFTRSLALEIGNRGVTVNAVAPGFIETDMTDELTDAQREQMLSRVALGRMGSAEDIAATVAFLVSDDASYITGATIPVNGGLYMS
ncbi:MAG: 3-oxoacyl-ACP reductase FabG [Gammaproteobacteria bacterium]